MPRTLLTALGTLLLAAAAAWAADVGEKVPAYDIAAEVQVNGDIVSVRRHAGWMGWDGVYLSVRTSERIYEVHLAPASFLELLELEIAEKDRVELKGCLAKVNGEVVLLVREIRRQNIVVNVRDPKGHPVW